MRRQIFTLIVGAQGCGKTKYSMDIANIFLNKLNKPVLAVIPDDEEKQFWGIEEIENDNEINLARNLHNHKTGIKKIFCEDVKMFDSIRANYRNGLILIDDARVYLKSRDEPFRRMIMRRRQMNCDILFICHGLSEVPPSCNSFITDLVLFEMLDDSDSWNISNPEKYKNIVSKINKIAQTTNRYHNERIILRNIKI